MSTLGLMSWVELFRGTYSAPVLSQYVRRQAQPLTIFRQFTTLEEDVGARMGTKFLYTFVGDVRSKGRRMAEFDRTPVTSIPIVQDFMEPFQIGNSIEFTWWTEMFSMLSPRHAIIRGLMDDYVKTVDAEVASEFLSADLHYTPIQGPSNKAFILSTSGGPAAVATRPFSMWDLQNVRGIMTSDLKIPPADGVNLFCVTTYGGGRNIRNDSMFRETARYDREFTFSGELGEIEGCRFFQENHILDSRLPGNNSQMVFFGADAVAEAVIYPFEIQAKEDPDYGDRMGIRYLEVLALKRKHTLAKTNSTRVLVVDSLPA